MRVVALSPVSSANGHMDSERIDTWWASSSRRAARGEVGRRIDPNFPFAPSFWNDGNSGNCERKLEAG